MTEPYAYFKAAVVGTGDGRHLVVKGEIDLHTAVLLTKHVTRLIEDGVDPLVLDLADVTFLDSSGINALVRVQEALGQRPEALVLRRASAPVRRVIELAGVQALFTFREG